MRASWKIAWRGTTGLGEDVLFQRGKRTNIEIFWGDVEGERAGDDLGEDHRLLPFVQAVLEYTNTILAVQFHMICRYCQQPKKLIQAHVIPEGFFRRLRENGRPPLLVKQNAHIKRSPIGIYDPNILCVDCDGIFAPWDDHVQKVLRPELPETCAITDGTRVAGWTITDFHYDLLKLFFISLLWRASVSQHAFYHRIKLGKFEARAKEMLAAGDAGQADEFGVIVARFTDPRAIGMLDPHPQRMDGIRYSQFYLGRYVAYIKTDSRPPSDEWRHLTMRPGQPLCILVRDLARGKELPVMREVLASAKQGKPRI